jgi:hypothetical protein
MEISDAIWAGIIGAGVAFEVYALTNGKQGDTLSETTRRTFRTRTRAGAILFGVAWGSFSIWYLGHILAGWAFPLS